MKTKLMKVAVPADMDEEIATLTACSTLLNKLAEPARDRIMGYLNHMVTKPAPLAPLVFTGGSVEDQPSLID